MRTSNSNKNDSNSDMDNNNSNSDMHNVVSENHNAKKTIMVFPFAVLKMETG